MLLRFDELNNLETAIREMYYEGGGTAAKTIPDRKRLEGEIFDLMFMAWAMGYDDARKALGSDIGITSLLDEFINNANRTIGGKTFKDRLRDDMRSNVYTPERVITLIETEVTNSYNNGVYITGMEHSTQTGRPVFKIWKTMLDDRVRDTHSYLEGARVPIDAEFYTYDGDHAPYPTAFTKPENSINCRCQILLTSF